MEVKFKLAIAVAGIGIMFFSGCAGEDRSAATEIVNVDDNLGQDHSGWWCTEHGVPEEECALCDTSLVAVFKAKNDWCAEHNRPESHCFVCQPENLDKFAARYEAKYGERPPQPTE